MDSSFILVQSMYFKLAVRSEKNFQVEFNRQQVTFLQSLKSNQVYQLPRQSILKMDHPDSSVLFLKVTLSNLKHRQEKSFLTNSSWESWSFLKGSTEIFVTSHYAYN